MFKSILSYFDSKEWKYSIPNEQNTLAILGVGTDNGNFQCIVDVNEETNGIIFFTIFPVNVPMEVRETIGALLSRINYGLFFGNFEMNFEDGEMRFRTSLFYDNKEISNAIIDSLVVVNITVMDSYFEILNSVIFEHFSVQQAIEKIAEIK